MSGASMHMTLALSRAAVCSDCDHCRHWPSTKMNQISKQQQHWRTVNRLLHGTPRCGKCPTHFAQATEPHLSTTTQNDHSSTQSSLPLISRKHWQRPRLTTSTTHSPAMTSRKSLSPHPTMPCKPLLELCATDLRWLLLPQRQSEPHEEAGWIQPHWCSAFSVASQPPHRKHCLQMVARTTSSASTASTARASLRKEIELSLWEADHTTIHAVTSREKRSE